MGGDGGEHKPFGLWAPVSFGSTFHSKTNSLKSFDWNCVF